MRACFALISLLAIAGACRTQARTSAPALPTTSRVIVHSTMPTPVGVVIREGVGIHGLSANVIGVETRPPAFVKVDAFPVELECPMRSLCIIAVRKRALALVFAFEPVVEIDLGEPPAGGSPYVLVQYRDSESESAALGAILTTSYALLSACESADAARLAHLRGSLHKRAKRDDRPVVRDSARLALVAGHCGTKPDVELARSLLAIEPTSPALALWTLALWRASEQLGHPADAIAALDAVIDRHPDPDVGAVLLSTRARDAETRGDLAAKARLDRRLFSAPFATTPSAQIRRLLALMTDPLRVGPGDALPAIVLPPLDGAPAIATAESGDAPQLLYFSASWCKGCVESLPKLRRFADEHPEVRIAYVLWDAADDAKAFVRDHAPVPGTVVRADRATRKALEHAFLKLTVLPTFVLADARGRVITTSTEHSIAELADVLARRKE